MLLELYPSSAGRESEVGDLAATGVSYRLVRDDHAKSSLVLECITKGSGSWRVPAPPADVGASRTAQRSSISRLESYLS